MLIQKILKMHFYYNGNGTLKNRKLSKQYLKMVKEKGLKEIVEKYKEYKCNFER